MTRIVFLLANVTRSARTPADVHLLIRTIAATVLASKINQLSVRFFVHVAPSRTVRGRSCQICWLKYGENLVTLCYMRFLVHAVLQMKTFK